MNILVAYKKSTVDFYSVSPEENLRQFIASDDSRAVLNRKDHEENERNLEAVLATLDRMGLRYDAVHRASMGCVAGKDLVIAVGGDGTFLDAAHHVGGRIPILGVNSNPLSSVGALLPYRADTLAAALDDLDRQPHHLLPRRRLVIDGVETGPAVLNDILYADSNPSASTNGLVTVDGGSFKHHNGSGVLVCTATGSAAFMWNEGGPLLQMDSDRILVHERSRRHKPFHETDFVEIKSWTRTGTVYVDGSHISYPAGIVSRIRFEPGAPPLNVIGDIVGARAAYIEQRSKE